MKSAAAEATVCIALLIFCACDTAQAPAVRVFSATEHPPFPPHWTGEGILVHREDLPEKAPQWADSAASVVSRNGVRYLHTSGIAAHMAAAMGSAAAENRARAEMARWLGTNAVRGAVITKRWQETIAQTYVIEVEAALPPGALEPAPQGQSE